MTPEQEGRGSSRMRIEVQVAEAEGSDMYKQPGQSVIVQPARPEKMHVARRSTGLY